MADLWAALSLVIVLEGLLLFAVPGLWKRAMAQLQVQPDVALRRAGAALLVVGLASLYVVRA
jgi:uncharacterized protein